MNILIIEPERSCSTYSAPHAAPATTALHLNHADTGGSSALHRDQRLSRYCTWCWRAGRWTTLGNYLRSVRGYDWTAESGPRTATHTHTQDQRHWYTHLHTLTHTSTQYHGQGRTQSHTHTHTRYTSLFSTRFHYFCYRLWWEYSTQV